MKPESAAIVRHIIDTIFLVVLGATIVVGGWTVGDSYCRTVIAWIAQLESAYVAVTVIGISAVVGWSLPRKVRASVHSVKLFRRHWGLVARVSLGCLLTLLLAFLTGLLRVEPGELGMLGIGVMVLESIVLLVGWLLGTIHLRLRDTSTRSERNPKTEDSPIQKLEENLFPEYEATARRILGRLELGRDNGGRGPNVAVIGAYGSGKTSLCNLVEDISRKKREQSSGERLVFCRFEAWQFLTADAAVRELLNQIVNKVQELVDCSRLGSLPEEYLDALRAWPNGWLGMIARMLSKRRSSVEIIQSVQDVLLRIGRRLVVFVDDFDRLESKSTETQEAIAAALNQLQNLTTVQYVLCVGRMREGPGGDLLKLTRFQELMPEVRSEEVIEKMRVQRDEAIRGEQAMYYPWDLKKEGNDDPLQYYPHRDVLNTTLVSKLVNLVETPRQLKGVEREMREKWNDGLNGEISWYDLVLMSALKVCEPGVFEWVIREQEVFLDEEIRIGDPNEEEKNEAGRAIEKRLSELIGMKTKARFELVRQVLLDLFPNFMRGLGSLGQEMTRGEPQMWDQHIALKPRYGTSYFRRYKSGCVPSTEVPDQRILQHIRDIEKKGFDPEDFEQRYLDTYQKLTHDLNRFVQFSGLLSEDLAKEICDCMVDWMCDREHWSVWDQEDEYVWSVMIDVKFILESAGQFEFVLPRQVRRSDVETTDTKEWAKDWLEKLASKDAIVGIQYANYVAKDILGERESKEVLGAAVKREFLGNEEAFWEQAEGKNHYLRWLLGTLKYNDDYESMRDQVTESILKIAEAGKSVDITEGVVISLVNYQYAASRPDLIDDYEFSVNKEDNQRTFNMDMVLPVLRRWEGRQFADQVAAKAFEHLMAAYAQELKELDS